MIDVVFLLIIFFMTTAQFVQKSRAELDLPKEAGQAEVNTTTPPMVINIVSTGIKPFIVGQTQLDLDGLLHIIDREIDRIIREEQGGADDMELILRADQNGLSRVLNELGNELRDRGVTHWRIAVEKTR